MYIPASHYVTSSDKIQKAIKSITIELEERKKYFKERNMLSLSYKELIKEQDMILMLKEIGFCQSIEKTIQDI